MKMIFINEQVNMLMERQVQGGKDKSIDTKMQK